jgi:cytochrome c biogenesis protein CcmG, thiol:disulfide interchange protein DsbE
MPPPTDNLQHQPQRKFARPPLRHWLWIVTAFFALFLVFMVSAEALNYAYLIYTKPPPSRLVGHSIPDFTMSTLGDPARKVTRDSLLGTPYLLSTWSSWCYGCREEHATVAKFAESKRIKVIGFNIQDETANAKAWLKRYGDPYAFTLVDGTAIVANRMEIFTSPHHVLVDARGIVRWKRSTIMDDTMIRDELLPAIAAMERQP